MHKLRTRTSALSNTRNTNTRPQALTRNAVLSQKKCAKRKLRMLLVFSVLWFHQEYVCLSYHARARARAPLRPCTHVLHRHTSAYIPTYTLPNALCLSCCMVSLSHATYQHKHSSNSTRTHRRRNALYCSRLLMNRPNTCTLDRALAQHTYAHAHRLRSLWNLLLVEHSMMF